MRIANTLTLEVVDAKPTGKKLVVSTAAPGQRGGIALEARLDVPKDLQAVADFLSEKAEAWSAGVIGGPRRSGPDPYRVLGIHPTAPWPLVVLLYKARAKREHPDKGGNSEAWAAVQAAFSEIEKQHVAQERR